MEKERKINKLRNKVKFNKKLIENEKKKNENKGIRFELGCGCILGLLR